MSDSLTETLYEATLRDIAMGATRDETARYLIRTHGIRDVRALRDVMREAAGDALDMGIEREDIDRSWYGWLA